MSRIIKQTKGSATAAGDFQRKEALQTSGKSAATKRMVNRLFMIEQTLERGLPMLRGKMHLLLTYLSPFWIVGLYRYCQTPLAYAAVSVSVFSCLFNFIISALHHNGSWSEKSSALLVKMDYAGIFVMISGSCAPVPLLVLEPLSRFLFLTIQWGTAIFGILTIIFGTYATSNNPARVAVYVGMGLSNALFFKQMFELLQPFEFVCLVSMGCFYIIGGIFYARRSPDLWPGIFGYHELFHFCCLVGAICTFLLNKSVLCRNQSLVQLVND